MPDRFRTLLICLGYMVVLIAAAVTADRLLGDRIYARPGDAVPAYRSAQDEVAAKKLHHLGRSANGYDALFIGNSRTLFGVDPELVDRELRRHGARRESYNLAMPTVDPRFWDVYFRKYFDGKAPRDVLLGITPRDLDRRNVVAGQYLQGFEASPAFNNRDRTGIWKDSEEALADLYPLRGRVEESKRVGVKGFLRGDRLDQRQIDLTGDHGWAAFADRDRPSPAELRRNARELRDRHGPGGLQESTEALTALDRLYRKVHADGGCLTLFTTPLLYDREQWGTIEIRRDFYRRLRAFARTHPGTRLVDVGRVVERNYQLADFGDGDHLSATGARRFARDLARALAPSMRAGRCG